MGKYFGTDGIRGKANVTLFPELAFKVGQGLALLNNKTLVIGWDTRESSPVFVENIMNGATSVGINVLLLGVIPTPGLILASRELSALGVMITASHNPYYDNGIKVVKNGLKINDEDKEKIENYIDGKVNIQITNDGKCEDLDFYNKYKKFLLAHSLESKMKIVIDCANGASSLYASLYEKISENVRIVANEPNGYNINEGVGATHMECITKEIKDYDLGIAFDGDADRIMVADKNKIYDGDYLVYIFAKYFKKKNMLNKNTVVLTKMSNLAVINKLNEEGINVVLTDVGDQNVIKAMEENGYSLGGENSGHIITPYLMTGDGLLNGLILISILEEEKTSIYELTKDLTMYFDKMINIKVNDKTIINDFCLQKRIKEIDELFGKYGKVILRASGTENLIRISVMHKEKETMEQYLKELVELVNTLNRE